MDYGKVTLDELKRGYKYDKETKRYICSYCGAGFQDGEIYKMEDKLYMAELAAVRHIETEHQGNLSQLLFSDTKYNTLTDKQRELLALFASGATDQKMAEEMNVSESTIRRQRFAFREKAKQAKFYLAVYEQIFGEKDSGKDQIMPIHNNAVYVDDRYLTTEQEKAHILDAFFESRDPLILKSFSTKEKNKVVILGEIIKQFEENKKYSEKEVNEILKPIYDDYMSIRRYLIMYGFMERTKDGSEYWVAK